MGSARWEEWELRDGSTVNEPVVDIPLDKQKRPSEDTVWGRIWKLGSPQGTQEQRRSSHASDPPVVSKTPGWLASPRTRYSIYNILFKNIVSKII